MSHDGTTHADAPEITARNIVDLYLRNINQYATPYDIYLVGNAILGDTDALDTRVEVIEEDITSLEEAARQILINKREIERTKHLIAIMTFMLLEQGIELENKEIINNLKLYLKYK